MRRSLLSAVVLIVLATVGTPTTVAAAPTVAGREWRELYETTGLSWSQVATVCPTDGVTPCAGSVGGRNLTGWVWATGPQVRDLLDDYAPGLTTAEPPVVNGIDGFWGAISFLGVMRWTTFTSLTYSSSEWTGGWTASVDPISGLPIAAGAGYSHQLTGSTATGSIGLGTDVDAASPIRGVFLWRAAGGDYTAPIVTPVVTGTLGDNGWYRSNVGISWTITDAESPIVTTSGCDPVALADDTAALTVTCTAVSAGQGGPGSGTTTIKRDASAPTVSCNSAPVFELGQAGATVGGTVSDALSGPSVLNVSQVADTSTAGLRTVGLLGTDRAGNSTTQSCGYAVVVPLCQGKTPTIVGTGGNDTIVGTSGVDVIQGLAGSDTITGLGKGDIICGGDGADIIYGGDGADQVLGGAGSDDLNGDGSADVLDGGADNDSIRGGAGADRCTSGEIRMSSCATLY